MIIYMYKNKYRNIFLKKYKYIQPFQMLPQYKLKFSFTGKGTIVNNVHSGSLAILKLYVWII